MSFDLIVLAMSPDASESDARAMAACCNLPNHVDGDIDHRIIAFYHGLTQQFPDHPPYSDDSPWALMPLGTGIDHVSMSLRSGSAGTPAIAVIEQLALRHDLILYDPQGDDVYLPR